MTDEQTGHPEETPAKRGQAYFNEAAAQVAKKNAEAQKAARVRNAEIERKRLVAMREADRKDVEAAIKAHGRG